MKLTHSINISVPPAEVFPWIADPQLALQWQTSVAGGEIIKQTPDMVGTTFRERVEENGQGTELIGEITEYIVDELIAFHLDGQFNSVDVSFRVEATEHGSRVTQDAEVRFKGLVKWLSLIFGRGFKKKMLRQLQQEFDKLKTLCEQNRDRDSAQ